MQGEFLRSPLPLTQKGRGENREACLKSNSQSGSERAAACRALAAAKATHVDNRRAQNQIGRGSLQCRDLPLAIEKPTRWVGYK